MAEEDLIWLLKTIGKSSHNFETLYGISFKIPDIICMKNGEPKFWFYMDRENSILCRDDELLKFKLMKEYFVNPRLSNNELYEMLSMETSDMYPQYGKITHFKEEDEFKKDLFYVVLKTYSNDHKEAKVMKKVKKEIVEELFKNPAENQDFFVQWIKAFSCFPERLSKKLSLYELKYSRNLKDEKGQYFCFRKNLYEAFVEVSDFVKSENLKQNKLKKPVINYEEKYYKVLSNDIIEKSEKFLAAIIRFIENKLRKKFVTISIEMFIDNNGQIWLIGCDKIQFFNQEGEIDSTFDRLNFEKIVKKHNKVFIDKCHGLYCNLSNELFRIYDENEEEYNLYLKNDGRLKIRPKRFSSMNSSISKLPPLTNIQKNKKSKIYYKSIILDLIERKKTLERIKDACPNLNDHKISQLSEFIILKFRKFYDLSSLSNHPFFKHQKVSNLYEMVKVCAFCEAFYKKIDIMRTNNISNGIKKDISNEELSKEINKYLTTNQNPSGLLHTREKQLYKNFDEKIQNFDMDSKYRKNFLISQKSQENFFITKAGKSIHSNNDQLSPRKRTESKNFDRPLEFQLPLVFHETISDKTKMVQKERLFISKKEEEHLGLKHFLGHTKNLPFSDSGLAVSKSSYQLNKLQDKISELDKIQNKFENKKIQLLREEIKLLNFPYLGKGKYDCSNFDEVLNNLKVNNKESSPNDKDSENSNQLKTNSIQVATDKDEFLTENERHIKNEQRMKEKEIYFKKKYFLETHNDLSNSILKRNYSPNRASFLNGSPFNGRLDSFT